jgi:DNA repair protein RadA/Sms
MSAKNKQNYQCQACGAVTAKWAGQCGECGGWNTLVEQPVSSLANRPRGRSGGYTGELPIICDLTEISITPESRTVTGIGELDRVLGGGIMPGSVILLGGDPGIGKSTLLLQTVAALAQVPDCKTLYVSGEESAQQVAGRAHRLGLTTTNLRLLTETNVERIIEVAQKDAPTLVVIDSIQTIYSDLLASVPGSVGQVRESAATLVRYAKRSGTSLVLIGHVTKEGAIAGPRVLEHMVDTVLYFEGDDSSRFRIVRSVKNRYGAVNELGVFAMTDRGLREVNNPSAMFLSRHEQEVPGSVVMVSREGTRPLLVEVQALVDESHAAAPRRVTVGLDHNRLAMLLAVLHRHGGIVTYDQDVFVNVVGGVRVFETGADLAVTLAVVSSLRNRALPRELVVFGEIGLAGEIRPVQNGADRLREAAKHGFTRAVVPKANMPKQGVAGLTIDAVETVGQALEAVG